MESKVNYSTNGLSKEEAKIRLSNNGLNELIQKKQESIIIKFIKQFKDFLVIILILAAVISLIVEPTEWIESLIILIVVIINAILGVYQENKAEKSIESLKKMSNPFSKVVRDGEILIIPSNQIVVGDLIIIENGDYIPADAKIIESNNLRVDESALTGESVPVDKECIMDQISSENVDNKNMVFASTFVTYGRAKAIVEFCGMDTQIGKIAKLLSDTKNKYTPLQKKLMQIGKVMGILSICICAIVFIFQVLTGVDYLNAFKTSVALAVAAIPEGLATVVTIILSIGVSRMARRKAIVKRLPAVETLGCTSVVCSDKTGTLTQNKMTVLEYYNGIIYDLKKHSIKNVAFDYFGICCDAKIVTTNGEVVKVGDPTETAIIEAQIQYGTNQLEHIERVDEIPFDSSRKLMTVVAKIDGKLISITKGAPEKVFSLCKNVSKKEYEVYETMANKALRVIALGIKEVSKDYKLEELENDLEFIGMIGMIDPERTEVKEAIKEAKEAGITTVMITGDYIITAKAIANNLGICDDSKLAITSEELSKMTDDQLDQIIEKIAVFARVTPSDKVRIVETWQRKQKVVAMTGDGVNDSPALKTADIGCAMGITGTDVAKEASAMILVDDNFSTIIDAVKEGRIIYSNIKKCVKYLLSSNIGEIFTIFVVSILSLIIGTNYAIPLLPIHLLWINLITDSLPAFALGMEEGEKNVMKKKPRAKNESFFANNLGLHIIIEGIIIGSITIFAYLIGYNNSVIEGQTMAFLTLSLIQLFHSFNMKSEDSILNNKLFHNKWLNISFSIGVLLQLLLIYIPGVNSLFGLEPLPLSKILISIGLAFSIIFIMEIYKLIKKGFK